MPRTITLDDDDQRFLVGVLDRAGSETLSESKRERCERLMRRIADSPYSGSMIHPYATLQAYDMEHSLTAFYDICDWIWLRAHGEGGTELLGSFQEFVQVLAAEAREVNWRT
jgi:hypothetical protein